LNVVLAEITLFVAVMYVSASLYSANIASLYIKANDQQLEKISSDTTDSSNRYFDIKANIAELQEQLRFNKNSRNYHRTSTMLSKWKCFDASLIGVLGSIGPLIVTVASGYMAFKGLIGIETVIAFSVATSMLFKPVAQLTAMPITFHKAKVSIMNVEEILRARTEESLFKPIKADTLEQPKGENYIRLENVSYIYSGNTHKIDLGSMSIQRGEKIAIVGPSGAGKSTLLRMLFRQISYA